MKFLSQKGFNTLSVPMRGYQPNTLPASGDLSLPGAAADAREMMKLKSAF
jgi:hypothetical protein